MLKAAAFFSISFSLLIAKPSPKRSVKKFVKVIYLLTPSFTKILVAPTKSVVGVPGNIALALRLVNAEPSPDKATADNPPLTVNPANVGVPVVPKLVKFLVTDPPSNSTTLNAPCVPDIVTSSMIVPDAAPYAEYTLTP